MTKQEVEKLKYYLENAIENYFEWCDREDFPDKPCVRKAVCFAQVRVFNLADMLLHNNIIKFEEWCEYITRVGVAEDDWIDCKYQCGANINGKCKYALEELEKTQVYEEYKKKQEVQK